MRLTDGDAEEYFAKLPEDVRAILSLFPDYDMFVGFNLAYCDLRRGSPENEDWVFTQVIAGRLKQVTPAQNQARFISWVRAGMPDGYGEGEKRWTRED